MDRVTHITLFPSTFSFSTHFTNDKKERVLMKKMICSTLIAFLIICSFGNLTFASESSSSDNINSNIQSGDYSLGDYSGFIRESAPRADGILHVDTQTMIKALKKLHVNTYYYLVWYQRTDWDDLRNEFISAAQEAGINVVVYLVPPSESSTDRSSYPYTTDYVAWAKAIAELSMQYPNLTGWAIDDFNYNLNSTYTPEYMAKMQETAKSINAKLSFMPLMYTTSLTEDFLTTRGKYIDGVIVAYRDDPYRNTQVWSSEQVQIDASYNLLKKYNLPLVWMLYTSFMTRTPANPSAEYVWNTVHIALDNMSQGKITGVITYELEKQFVPEADDKKAFSGNGYLSLFVPAGVRTKPGDNVSAIQMIHPDGSGSYSLSFRTMQEGPNLSGYHFKQVLIDDAVVWQQDSGVNPTGRTPWEEVVLDLSPYLAGKTSANLTLRLYENNGVGNFFDNSGFDSLQATGFTITNGDFEQNRGWAIKSTTPGMIGSIQIYDPDRRRKVFEVVRELYGWFSDHDQSEIQFKDDNANQEH
jgi:hypothetical protein